MTFSEKLFDLRKKNAMSQEELADKLGVSRQAISRWEMGTAMPDAPNLLKLSETFNVSIDYLLKDDYKEPTAKRLGSDLGEKIRQTDWTDIFKKVFAVIMIVCQVENFILAVISPNYFGAEVGLFIAVVSGGLNILIFELVFKFFKDKSYRKLYYSVSVWCFTVIPAVVVGWLAEVAVQFITHEGVSSLVGIAVGAVFYLAVCVTVTVLLNKHCVTKECSANE